MKVQVHRQSFRQRRLCAMQQLSDSDRHDQAKYV